MINRFPGIKPGIKTILLLAVIVLFFLSCATTLSIKGIPGNEEFIPPKTFKPEWENVAKGIDKMIYHQSNPAFTISAVRVNLSVREREVIVSKGEKVFTSTDTGEGNFTSNNIKQFINSEYLFAAINATPFTPYRFFTGKTQTAVGIVKSAGNLYSENSKYDALFVTKDKRILFLHPPFTNINSYIGAAGGFFIILSGGINIAKESPRAARSLIGTAENGRVVFLVSIDGENTQTGSGATFFESAEWMKSLGSENAINMDGGGSSVLALRSSLNTKIEILNHPDGGILTFFQRNVPVFIGIR